MRPSSVAYNEVFSTHWQNDVSAQNQPTSDNKPDLQYDTLKKKEDMAFEQSPEVTNIPVPDSDQQGEATTDVS